MKEIHVNSIVLLLTVSLFFEMVLGIIKNDEENIIREDERRGTGQLENDEKPDQDTYSSFKRDVWAIGQNPKVHHDDCQHGERNGYVGGIHRDHGQQAYGLVGPDNLAYPIGTGGQYVVNTKLNELGYGYGYPGESGFSYGYGGGGISGLGHSGGGAGHFGHSEAEIGGYGYGGGEIGSYGHSGGGVGSYGHSAGGVGSYGHSGGSNQYGHIGGGFGGLTSLIHKKLSLKKIILPIAAIALLGAAAAMTTNPVLLQLGTISGRRKRSVSTEVDRHAFPQNPFVRPNRV